MGVPVLLIASLAVRVAVGAEQASDDPCLTKDVACHPQGKDENNDNYCARILKAKASGNRGYILAHCNWPQFNLRWTAPPKPVAPMQFNNVKVEHVEEPMNWALVVAEHDGGAPLAETAGGVTKLGAMGYRYINEDWLGGKCNRDYITIPVDAKAGSIALETLNNAITAIGMVGIRPGEASQRAWESQVIIRTYVQSVEPAPKGIRWVIDSTRGVEWEWTPVKTARKGAAAFAIDYMLERPPAGVVDLGQSRFRQLFGLYGRDSSGHWLRNLIPRDVLVSKSFQEAIHPPPLPESVRIRPEDRLPSEWDEIRKYDDLLKRKYLREVELEVRDGNTYITNFDQLSPEAMIKTMKILFESRGPYGDSLRLRKNTESWSHFQGRYDTLIPDQVSEEWRFGKFVNIEFPMDGHVHNSAEAREYLGNLWTRLGLFEAHDPKLQEALDEAIVHVHWVPDVQSISHNVDSGMPDLRKTVYQAIIGLWGDANDAMQVSELANAVKNAHVQSDGSVTLDPQDIIDLSRMIKDAWTNGTINVLRQEDFNRLSATDQGITVVGRLRNLNPQIDPSFPPEFKFLPVGLRGKYSPPPKDEHAAVSVVGLEARNTGTIANADKILPSDVDGKADLGELLQHGAAGPRGLISDPQLLRDRVQKLGISPDLFDRVETQISELAANPVFHWSREQMRAIVWLPLNTWESHPLRVSNLHVLPASKARELDRMLQMARARYSQRLASIRLANAGPVKQNATQPLTEVIGEVFRFVKESDLAQTLDLKP